MCMYINVHEFEKGVLIYLVLIRVVYEGQENIVDELKLELTDTQLNGSSLEILSRLHRECNFVDIICDPSEYTEELKDNILDIVGKIIYKFVINIFNEKEIDYFFNNYYFFIKYDETDEIKEKVIKVLLEDNFSDDNFFGERKKSILEKIKSCIEENNEININGFIRFRMKELFQEIEQIVDKIVERHIIEKEYNEFIKLLKYFVEVQESKIDEVNIIIDEMGMYTILDGNSKDIYDLFLDEVEDFNMSLVGVNKDDLLISGLIANSPKKIVIHGAENTLNVEIIETIKQVFEEKVIFCTGCTNCIKIQNKLIK